MSDYDAPVQGTPAQLAELRRRLDDDLDSRTVVAFAESIGVRPPAEPEGWQGWAIVDAFPNGDYDNPVLYWLGPQPDHGSDDLPERQEPHGGESASAEEETVDPWA